jgi:hypothetical protein
VLDVASVVLQKGLNGIVRGAVDMKIAQHFLVLGIGRDLLSSPCNGRLKLRFSRGFQADFQPSASRTVSILLQNPSDKSLGYSH